ncbi:hypothetical protein [Rhodococcus sp. 14-2470-1b]|uniref:hypothetical protein n=1 Tax=Rhodococcus sp. 14-2470-1b TaxID=2023149 RepID=UPI0015963AD5|nr:hypothetical protein [Rhodococcus sp. 14-2470-1b]
MRKYQVLMKSPDGDTVTALGTFDTLLEANTWIRDEGHRDEHELGTYDVAVVDE